MAEPVDLVIFDCDGVLIDSEGLSAEVLIEALAREGIDVDFDYFCTTFVGRSFATVANDIRTTFRTALPPDFEKDYRRDLLARFENRLRPTPGVLDMLTRLGTRRCVATSSSPERVAQSLRIAGLTREFDGAVFTASEVRHGKPAPDLFLHAASRMDVPPARCMVVEDSLPGVEAAQAAGMRVLRYTGGAHLAGRVLKHARDVVDFDNWQQIFLLLPELEKAAHRDDHRRQTGSGKHQAG